MNIVLVSGRAAGAPPHPSRARAEALARAFAAAGHDVRWLCLLQEGEPAPEEVAGVRIVAHAARVPPFRAVLARVFELGAERALTALLRGDPPAVVYLLAHGGATSAHLPWLGERLGVPVVVDADLASVFCHRGTLVDERSAHCVTLDDAARCTACCLAAGPGALRPLAAGAGRMLRGLGDLSPFPNLTAFRNRHDVVIAGLLSANAVLVRDSATRDALVAAGVPKRIVRVLAEPTPAALLEIHAELQGSPTRAS